MFIVNSIKATPRWLVGLLAWFVVLDGRVGLGLGLKQTHECQIAEQKAVLQKCCRFQLQNQLKQAEKPTNQHKRSR